MFPIIFAMLAILGASAIALSISKSYAAIKRASIAAGIAILALASYAAYLAIYSKGFIGSVESINYISQLGISLSFSITVASVLLVLLSSIVCLAALFAVRSKFENSKNLYPLILLFEFASIGLFSSSNLFLFYIFWDVGVVASYFTISSFGSQGRKQAANTFLIYSIFASALLLFGIMTIYFYTPVHSFDISYITSHSSLIPQTIQALVFSMLFIAFMVKMPIFPFHSWISNAYSEAPTQGSMVIAGVLSKYGAYGMLLIFSMFSMSYEFAKFAFVIGTISAFYAAFVAMRQTDLKRIAAYTSMVESGIILVGISSLNAFGTSGALYLMLAHGLTIALMFGIIGGIEIAFGSVNINVLRGIVKDSMSSAYSFLVGVFASTGIPLTAGFIADVLLFIGAIKSFGLYGVLPLFSIMLVGFYLYYVVNKSFLSTKEHSDSIAKVPKPLWASYAILAASIFMFGIFPSIMTGILTI